MKTILILSLLLFFAFSRSTYASNDSLISLKQSIEIAEKIIEGDIIKAERKFREKGTFVEIEVLTAKGGRLNLELENKSGAILSLESKEGPFDYEIFPGDNIQLLSKMKKMVEENTGDEVLKWKLSPKKDSKWEYEFWTITKSGKANVRINADSGVIITKPPKKEPKKKKAKD
ncbi:hypothetical protein BH10BAC5_BH10BAC5_08910 [soil metagenome]